MGSFFSSSKEPSYALLETNHPQVGLHTLPPHLDKVTQVCLAGGGVKGLAHLGALEAFVKADPSFLKRIKGWSGTSAGGILASLLAVGWSLEDLKALVEATDFSCFLDESLSFSFPHWIKDLYLLDHYEGLCSGAAFYEFMGVHLMAKTGSKDTTLKDLWDAKGVHLVLTVTDLRRREAVHLDYRSHPDLPIRLGVRMTMSIPFVFQPLVYKDMICVDGGMLDNMPLHVFDKDHSPETTIGLMLETPDEWYIDQELPAPDSGTKGLSLASLASTLIDVWQAEMRRRNFGAKDQERLVVIPVPDLPLTTFSLAADQKTQLLEAYEESLK